MRIGGFVDISTKDIPERASMVLFTVGCNFQCGYCHNKQLLQPQAGKEYKIRELLQKIKSNKLVGGISITGGEPTLQPDIRDFIKEISKLDKYISLDTNGSKPDILREVLPYLNRVALDVKAPYNNRKLRKITKTDINPTLLKKTFHLLNHGAKIDFEIRTTYEPNLLDPEDIHAILDFLQDQEFRGNFILQQYQYNEGVTEKFRDKFKRPPHFSLINILKPYVEKDLSFQLFIRDEAVGYENVKAAIKKFEE